MDTLRHLRGVGLVRNITDKNRKLVAAHARNGVSGPDHADQTAGDRYQQTVAGRVAEAVVDELEAVEIEIKYREPQLIVAFETAQRLLQAVDEQHPVGQPGQCVVQRTVDQLVFRFLALGDAADRAGHTHFLARGVGKDHTTRVDPDVVATLVAQPMLVFEMLALGGRLGRNDAPQLGDVFRMHAFEPVLQAIDRDCLRQTEQLVPARRKVGAVAGRLPIPDAVVGTRDRQCVALLDLDQRLLRTLPLHRIEDRTMQQSGIDLPLDQVVLRTGPHRACSGAFFVAVGEDDDRHTRRSAGHVLVAVETLGVGQMQVEQDNAGAPPGIQLGQCRADTAHVMNRVLMRITFGQIEADDLRFLRVIFDEQDIYAFDVHRNPLQVIGNITPSTIRQHRRAAAPRR